MKALKPTELRELGKDELEQKLDGLRNELFRLRCQSKSGNVPNSSRIRQIRRDIARVLTILDEKEVKKDG
jgi:large subunit ribosomal protein L29